MLERRMRPSRGEIDAAAMALLARHSGQILATARRYAASSEDAEDAYQRGLEILLTKAPTTREEELVPWLKTVVKHEAFALRRQRDRITPVTGDGKPVEGGTAPAATHEQAERWERLSHGAEALRRLKPQEVRCLVLKAQGMSYREICETTGFTYTKVNRCLTEGRQALTRQLAGIEDGAECARLAPLLSALADGEADADAVAHLRPHLRSCLACRARLREFRTAPARVAALMPAAVAAAPDRVPSMVETALGALQQKAEALLGATQQKAAALGDRAHAAVELATGQKVAAVAASAAVIAGGGTAVDQLADHHWPARPPAAAERPRAQPRPLEKVGAGTGTPAATTTPTTSARPAGGAATTTRPPRKRPDPVNEFGPSGTPAATPGSSSTSISTARAGQAGGSTGAATPPATPEAQAGAAGEFAP